MAGAGARRGLAVRSDEATKQVTKNVFVFFFMLCGGARGAGRPSLSGGHWHCGAPLRGAARKHCRGVCARPHPGQTGLEGRLRLHM